jgi:acetyl esterase/lipase
MKIPFAPGKIRLALLPLLFSTMAMAQTPAPEPESEATEAPLQKAPPGIQLSEVEIGHGGNRILHAVIAQPTAPSAKPMPAIILIHGGGWRVGTYRNIPFARVSQGYVMASIEYRLSPEAKWPAQIEDCKLGVRWLRANAAKYNVDPNRIGCMGGSAGGHLVACLGTMDAPELEGNGGYPGVSSKVQAVVDQSGPTDFTEKNFGKDDPSITAAGLAHDQQLAELLLGAPFASNPAVWKQASPITWVKPGDPPFFILQSETDTIVSPEQATTFAAALKKAGVPVELVMIKGAPPKGHSINGGQPDMATWIKEIDAFFDKYLKA